MTEPEIPQQLGSDFDSWVAPWNRVTEAFQVLAPDLGPAPEPRPPLDAIEASASASTDPDLEAEADGGDDRPDPDEFVPGLPDEALRAALEAILMVVDDPVATVTLAQVLEEPTARVEAILRALVDDYTATGRGFELRQVAGGWRFYTRPAYSSYVERFVLDGQQVRLTQAALETLAVVAYKQPVSRSRVAAIRGVNCDGVIKTLVTRGLVEECGTEEVTGAHLYRTTKLFLEKLGINSIDDLPPIAPYLPDNIEEIEFAQP